MAEGRQGVHAVAMRKNNNWCVSHFPASSYFQKCDPGNNGFCASSYSLSEEAKPWPWPTLQRKTFGCCACAKSFHLRLTRKRWQKVRSGGKKAGKKCHSTRTRGKVGPTQHAGPKVGPKNIYYFQTPWKLVQRTKWAPSAFKFLQPSGASILYWNSAEA